MALLVDLFGYLSIVLHGAAIVGQSMALGGVVFLLLLARPFADQYPEGAETARRTARVAGWAALGLAVAEALTLAMQAAVLVDTVGISVPSALTSASATAILVRLVAALVLAGLLLARRPAPALPLVALSCVVVAAATMTTHAAARMEGNAVMLAASALHIAGAAIWIGGIPSFVMALGRVRDGAVFRLVGARFSRISTAGVLCIVVSAAAFSVAYIGTPSAVYGTAYGVMAGTKGALFAALLLLGLGNFLLVERLRRDPATPVLRLRRFAEVEIGVGFTLFFAAASITSVPPAVDLTRDRVTWAEIVERNTPRTPRLQSPEKGSLALLQLQAQIEREDAGRAPPPALTPGSGELPPRNAADIAWSEYNHHWAGMFVLLIGMLSLLNRAGVGWARHWPLVFLGLAGFLLIRSDPEVWPLGPVGFWESFRDVEVLQHRAFVVLTAAFAFFEWGVRTGHIRDRRAALAFPLLTAVGGALLLTHSHAIANVRDQLLIELTHTPLALAGMATGWARWLELRADGRTARIASWVWPLGFVLVGVILLLYRES